jgi:PPOX class probable F420-dependent enzyme
LPVPKLTTAERDEFLQRRGVLCHIATIRPDGAPSVTPIWYLYRDGRVFVTPRAHSVWRQHLVRDPRVSLSIDEEPTPYRKVRIEGSMRLDYDLGEDDTWRDLYRDIARRYVSPEGAEAYIQATIDQPRALYSIGLDEAEVLTWRMPLEGEDGTGIWHRRYYVEGSKMAERS